MFRSFPAVVVGGLVAGANYVIDALGIAASSLTSVLGSPQTVTYMHFPQEVQNWMTPIGVMIASIAIVGEGFYYAAWNGHPPARGIEEKPAEKPVLLEKKAEPKAIAPAVSQPTVSKWDGYRDGLLAKQKKAVSEIELLVNSLHADANKLSDEDAYDYEQIVNHHLPTSLDLYKKAAQRRGDKSEAAELINSQLDNMKSGLETIYSHVNEGMLHEMRIQSSFLDTKYAKKVKATALKSK